ncbi:MAG: lipoyl(octanoyl) transferase LipB [Planctomycetota bacterium]|nr:lipoyl(octanoyl) transferase LipB [Planctomycetota bacterium]
MPESSDETERVVDAGSAAASRPFLAPRVTDLGRLAYAPALELQRTTHQRVLDRLEPPTILLVEHDPVITVSQRPDAAKHLLADAVRLARLGIDVQLTDRGGDITYHGPGQLVVYPILPLADFGLNLSRYMRLLEQAVIDAVGTWGVEATREPGATGVWVRRAIPGGPGEKICAMGVRIRKNVTMHGLALNVTTDLSHFDTIVPCGLAGRSVTSLAALLGSAAPTMDAVKSALVACLVERLRAAAGLRGGDSA